MAKKIRFPLEMDNGVEVRSIEELRNNFSVARIIGYVKDGKLVTWLRDRYANDLADAVEQLDQTDAELAKKVSDIFDVPFVESSEQDLEKATERIERLKRLKEFTDEKKYLDAIDQVAFDQDDLYDLLDDNSTEIYLCGNSFEIPLSKAGIHYIGINNPEAVISSKTIVDWDERQIQIENVQWDSKYQSILNKNEEEEVIQNNANNLLELFKMMRFKELVDSFNDDEADDEAYYMMYRVYSTGNIDVVKDESRGKAYLLEGYEKGYPICSVAYAMYSNLTNEEKMQIYSQCKPQLQIASDRGNILATHELGVSYLNETDEVVDYAKALEYFNKNMKYDNFWLSAYSIALRYHNGQGVEKNYKMATEYYYYALEHGHIWAYIYSIDLYNGWVENSELKLDKARNAFYKAVGINAGKEVLYQYIHNRMWFNKFNSWIRDAGPQWSWSTTFSSKSQAINEYKSVQYNYTEETNRKFMSEVDSYMEQFQKRLERDLTIIQKEFEFCKQNSLAEKWGQTTINISPITNLMNNSPVIVPCLDRYEVSDMQYNGLFGGHEVHIYNSMENYSDQWDSRCEYIQNHMPEVYNQTIIEPIWEIISSNWVSIND